MEAGYEESNYRLANLEGCYAAELHVIGVYESVEGHSGFRVHDSGPIDVVVRAGAPKKLVLRSYEPTEWRIELDAGAVVTEIWADGYHEQTVTGVAPGTVVHLNTLSSAAYAYGWEPENGWGGGGDFADFIGGVRAQAGQMETTFQGCYESDFFVVE